MKPINSIVELQREFDEFKDLPYWTLMKILEIYVMAYDNDPSCQIQELEDEVSDLKDENENLQYELNSLQFNYDKLKEDYDELLSKQEK